MPNAIILDSPNQPLELKDVGEIPRLASAEVLIRIDAAGVCFKDVLVVDGFQPRVKFPIVLGHEGAGRVEAVGDEVTAVCVGDLVCALPYISCGTCKFCTSGRENICRNRKWLGEDQHGSYSQFMRTHEHAMVKVPNGVTPDTAAAATCVLGTVIHGLKRLGNLKPEEVVLVTGAAGAVGANAILVANALGACTIGTDLPEKIDQVRAVGADYAIPFSDRLSDEVKKITGGEGVDLVLEAVGPPTFEQSFRSVRWGGRIVVIGNVSPSQMVPLALGPLILRENVIYGCMNTTKADLIEALDMIDTGQVVPETHTVLPLKDAQRAHDLLRQRRSTGKIILRPNQ